MCVNEMMDARERRAELMIESKALAAAMNQCRYASERIQSEKNPDDKVYGEAILQRIYTTLYEREVSVSKTITATMVPVKGAAR